MILKFHRKISGKKTEDELITEFTSSQDLEVLGELYSAYMHLVYGVCLKYLKDREESRDAVMQIFEKLISEIPKQRIENFRSWLHVVTKNYCLMHLRSEKQENQNIMNGQSIPGIIWKTVTSCILLIKIIKPWMKHLPIALKD